MTFFGRRTPLILQSEAPECGIACVAMVASFHGLRSDLSSMRLRLAPSMKGVTLAHISQIAQTMGLSARGIKVELSDLVHVSLPAILHWDMSHFVVLVKANARGITVYDPALGKRQLSLDQASKHFTGIAMEMQPGDDFVKKDERKKFTAWQMVANLAGLRSAIAQIFLLSLVLEVFAIAAPFFLQLVVDRVVISRDQDLLTVLGVGFAGIAVLSAITTGVRAWLSVYLSTHLNLRLLDGLFGRLLRLPLTWFERRNLGDIFSRFLSVDAIARTLTLSFVETIMDGMMVLLTVAVMVWYSPQLAALVLCATLIYSAARWALYGPQRRATDEKLLHEARANTHFIETLRGMMAIKLNRRENERRSSFQNLVVEQTNADVKVQQTAIAHKLIYALVFSLENIAVVWVGAHAVMSGALSIGMLFGFIGFKLVFVGRINNLTDKLIEFRMLDLHAERVADIVLATPEPVGPASLDTAPKHFAIQGTGIGFAYGVEGFAFRGVDVDIQPGELVAIIGPSGAGKTTLVKVLVGLIDRSEGQLQAAGRDMREWDPGVLRSRMGVVMQDDQLFVGSIEDNISFFDPQHDAKRARACAKLAMVDQEIEAMPMQYNTIVGSLGTAMSGGQKQRVLLARALYRQPAILFLDETFDQLDLDQEQSIVEGLRALGMSIVIVSHRPDTVRSVDKRIRLGA